MGRGRRYVEEPKLNLKKVFGAIIVIILIILFIVTLKSILSKDTPAIANGNDLKYFALYTNNKWGVINSKGETIIEATYDEMIVIPDNSKPLFICTYNVNYDDESYETKVLNEKNQEILVSYKNVSAIDNFNEENILWYEENVLKYEKDEKYGLIDFSGSVLLSPEYDNIYALEGMYKNIVIEKDGKIGIVDNSGKIVFEPEYQNIASIPVASEKIYPNYLKENTLTDTIGKWKLGTDLNMKYYTDK